MVVDFEENKDEAGVQRRKPHGLCIAINTAHWGDCGDHVGFWDMVTVKRMPGLGLTSANSCQFCPKDYGPQDHVTLSMPGKQGDAIWIFRCPMRECRARNYHLISLLLSQKVGDSEGVKLRKEAVPRKAILEVGQENEDIKSCQVRSG